MMADVCVCVETNLMAKREWKVQIAQNDLIHMPTLRIELIFMACRDATNGRAVSLCLCLYTFVFG